MSDQSAATTAREAKTTHQTLKELLNTKEPFDREVDLERKKLRRRYLNLLLIHPYAKESKDVENHLWMQTSHAFITMYRQRILALDRLIQNRQKPQQQSSPPPQRPNNTHIVEHRKLVQRFRQFLAEEEKFWTQLIARLRRSFALNEATPSLLLLGILSEAEDAVVQLPESLEARENGAPPSNGRNHFQFPPEDASISLAPPSPAEKEAMLSILSKALICLGDIARYRELYNEGGGRARAGHEDLGPPRRGRNRRGGQSAIDAIPRPRNYEKAQQCYEQARLLVPHDGNPAHQLAIIASYQKDSFASLVHYYRALCVRQPYETAAENLGNVLAKAMEQWRNRSRRERERTFESSALAPRIRIELLKEKVVVMHALWKVGMEKGVKKMNSISHEHPRGVRGDFVSLVSERHLPTEMITSTIILSQGALWKHRMIRDNSNIQSRKPEGTALSQANSTLIEWAILSHLLDLHLSLLEVGQAELKVPPPTDAAENDLAQRITATFRRTLPALRLASKWLRANYEYLSKDPEFKAYQEKKKEEGSTEVTKSAQCQISRFSKKTREFWQFYAEFMRDLTRSFPVLRLPSLTAPLEEDIEMRGFLPLKNLMGGVKGNEGLEKAVVPPGQQAAHPNDWQLMRIADLINDAKALASISGSPVKEYGGHIMFNPEVAETPSNLGDTRDVLGAERDDDNMTEITSRTDDDGILVEAFQQHLNPSTDDPSADDDDEDDRIVWDVGLHTSPPVAPALASPIVQVTPITPVKSLSPGKGLSPTHSKIVSPFPVPSLPAAAAHVAPTTAEDLASDVFSGKAIGGALSHLDSSATAPPLLFNHTGQNIWSASQEEQSLKFTSRPNQMYSPRQFSGPSLPDPPQPVWPSYTPGFQDSQHYPAGPLPSSPFSNQHQSMMHGHHRVASMNSGPQHLPNYYVSQHGPHPYAPAAPQQPIHRPDPRGPPIHPYLNSPVAPHPDPGMYYENPQMPGYHTRHLSHHDPRIGQSFAPPSMSQVWGNVR